MVHFAMAAQDLVILSPEKTIISFRLATVGSRILAMILDIILIISSLLAITFILAMIIGLSGTAGAGTLNGIVAVIFSLGPFAYFILFEGFWNGQTIGKKALGIRVRMTDGTPITIAAAIGRNLLLPADLFPGTGFVGLLAMFTNVKCQRIGDLISGTIVLHEKKPEARFTAAPHVIAHHPLEQMVGDLNRMNIEEYNALRLLVERFPNFPRTMQLRLMSEVWQPFADRHQLPSFPGVDPVYVAEAVVMRYGRIHGML